MHIQTVSYTRTFNLGNYSSEKIGVEFSLNQGESADKALDAAKNLVEEYHKENVAKLKKLGYFNDEEEEVFQKVPEKIIATQTKKTLVEKTKEFIDSCSTRQELKSWELMTQKNPELQHYYNLKFISLKS